MIRAVATLPTPRERRLAYLSWTAVCIIWGTTYLGIRITLETMPPALMASLRWLIASALLIGYMRVRGEPLPPSSRWGGIAGCRNTARSTWRGTSRNGRPVL